ncbi:hypothetical protein CSB67_0659 [Enterobacter hormaechei]|nr:hypothetical protein CSB67_0659 [Enterobacter hormaechei]
MTGIYIFCLCFVQMNILAGRHCVCPAYKNTLVGPVSAAPPGK